MASALFNPLHLPGSSLTKLPAFIYGTAWKKDLTASLVVQALQNGFTAIDTACQPRHYREDLVGEGVRKYLSQASNIKRSDLYVQSKFTSVHGQDPNNIPYNPRSNLREQVQKSIETSLKNFTSSESEQPYLDSLVLHSPMPSMDETLEVWRTLEQYVPDRIRNLGISNTNLYTLMELYEKANVKPAVVQNRFYAQTKHDIAVRKFCVEKGIIYQSFWTLTGNPNLIKMVLNGTTNVEHMKGDWDAMRKAKEFAEAQPKTWQGLLRDFKKTIGEVVD